MSFIALKSESKLSKIICLPWRCNSLTPGIKEKILKCLSFALRKKCPYPELFWSVFSRIRTEYGEIQSISPYSFQMLENTDQKTLGIWTLFTQYRFIISEFIMISFSLLSMLIVMLINCNLEKIDLRGASVLENLFRSTFFEIIFWNMLFSYLSFITRKIFFSCLYS